MLLGHFLDIAFAYRYVLFNKDGDKIGGYWDKDDIPQEYKNAYITFVTTDDSGSLFLTIQFGDF